MSITDFFTKSKLIKRRFKIIRELGKGNFGETFLAQDLHNGKRNCVVKKFLPNLSEADNLRDLYRQKAKSLFKDEANLLGILGNHNQIPSLLAHFNEKDDFYIVQEYVDGEDLHSELERTGIFNEPKIWDFLIRISTVLEYVHSNKIVHRDINPSNLMRRFSDNQIFLIDFGASRQIYSSPPKGTKITLNGTTIGTKGYTPYSQYHLGKVDYSNDLFSVGATCFNLMTNLSPPELCDSIGDKNGDKWVEHYLPCLDNSYSRNLVSIVRKLLMKDTDSDYVSISEMLKDSQKSPNNILTVKNLKKVDIDLSDAYIWTEEYKIKNLAQYKENIKVLEEKIRNSEIEMPKSAYEAMKRDSDGCD